MPNVYQVGLASGEVLGVDDMHLQLGVVTDSEFIEAFSLLSLLQLVSDFLLLACVVNDVAHDFLTALQKFVSCLDILHDEFLPGAANKVKISIKSSPKETVASTYLLMTPSPLTSTWS